MSVYKVAKNFRLKPYPTRQKSNESLRAATFFLMFAALNFLMVAQEGGVALIFALLFTFSGLRHLSRGLKLRTLPAKDRAYRISDEALIKVLDQAGISQLTFTQIKALWINEQDTELFLMSRKGIEVIQQSELFDEAEWHDFTQNLERAFAHKVWNENREKWGDIQKESFWMKSVYLAKTPISNALIYLIIAGCVTTFSVMFTWIDQISVLGLPQLVYIDLGAYVPWIQMQYWYDYVNYFIAPFLHYNLLQAGLSVLTLHTLGRWIERIFGGPTLLVVYLGSLSISTILYSFLAEEMVIGSAPASLALMGVVIALMNQKSKRLPLIFLQKFSVVLWLIIGHIIFFIITATWQSADHYIWLLTFITSYAIFKNVHVTRDMKLKWISKQRLFYGSALFVLTIVLATKITFWISHSNEERLQRIIATQPTQEKILLESAYRCSQAIACNRESAEQVYDLISSLSSTYPLSKFSSKDKKQTLLHKFNLYFMFRFEKIETWLSFAKKRAIVLPQDIYGSSLIYAWNKQQPKPIDSITITEKLNVLNIKLKKVYIQAQVKEDRLVWKIINSNLDPQQIASIGKKTDKPTDLQSNTEKSNTEKSNTEKSNTEKSNTEKSNTEKSNTEKSNTEKSNTEKQALLSSQSSPLIPIQNSNFTRNIVWIALAQGHQITHVLAMKLNDQPVHDKDLKALKEGSISLGKNKDYSQLHLLTVDDLTPSKREVPQIYHWRQQATTEALIEQLNQL
jgi:membrane associated rhomboid family serine protease